jgi:hypothetical protein
VRAECLLSTGRPEQAREVALQAREMVLGLAATIDDPEFRRSFLENVEPCARALALCGQLS